MAAQQPSTDAAEVGLGETVLGYGEDHGVLQGQVMTLVRCEGVQAGPMGFISARRDAALKAIAQDGRNARSQIDVSPVIGGQ